MGSLHATINVTLDGCCEHSQVVADEQFHDHMAEAIDRASALLFGRATYELLHDYWPQVAATGRGSAAVVRLARVLDSKPKYVVTRRDRIAGWRSSLASVGPDGEGIRALKERTQGVLLLVASPSLARTLAQLDLVDEYHIAIQPIVAGRGPTFLAGISHPARLELHDSMRLESGVVVHRYGVSAKLGADEPKA